MDIQFGDHASEEFLLEKEGIEIPSPSHRKDNYWLTILYWAAQVGFFLVSLSLCLHGILNLRECKLQTGASTWYDRHVSNERIYHRFEEQNSAVYRHPGPEADAAWDRLLAYPPFRINASTAHEIAAPSYAVTYPPSLGGGYRANLGVFHHLHCVKILWQFTHRDYYQTREPWFFGDTEEKLHSHLDHCADVVRQALMCNPDLSLETFHESSDPEMPDRNHDIPRSCRDYERVLEWVREQPRVEGM